MKQDIATLASTTMRVSFAILALTAAMATEATDVAAQSTPFADCGKECYQCGPGGLQMEGRGSSPTGAYDMNCPDEPSNTCSRDACSSAFMSVAEVGPGDLEVLATLRDAPLEALPALIARYGSRLLLHDSRRLVAIRGTSCGSGSVTGLVFLSRDKIRALTRLPVRRLEAFVQFTG